MRFPRALYSTAISFVFTSILVQSFDQLLVRRDPSIDSGSTKKLTRISADHGEPSIWNHKPRSNMGHKSQASGDAAVGRHLIRKRDTTDKNTNDEEYTRNSLIHRKMDRRYRREWIAYSSLDIYELDRNKSSMSVRLTSFDLEHKVDYEVAIIINATEYRIETFQVENGKLECKLWDNVLCFEIFKLPELVEKGNYTNAKLQVSEVKNHEKIVKWYYVLPREIYKRAPSPPRKLTLTYRMDGVVKLKWQHPWVPYGRIKKFNIKFHILVTRLQEDYKAYAEPKTADYLLVLQEQKEYEFELYFIASSLYRISVTAVNQHGAGQSIQRIDWSPSSVGFKSETILSEIHNRTWIQFEVLSPINATIATWVTVTVEGYLKCTRIASSDSPSTPEQIKNSWDVAKYQVNKKTPRHFKIGDNSTYDSEFTCFPQPGHRYIIKAEGVDMFSNNSVRVTSSEITFPNGDGTNSNDPGAKQNLGWLTIFPIIAIILLLLFVWHRRRRRAIANVQEIPIRPPSYSQAILLTPTVASRKSFPALAAPNNLILQPGTGNSRTSAYLYSIPNEPDSWCVPMENFEEYVKNAVSSAQLNSQFKLLPKGLTKPSDYGRLLGNIKKNRSTNQIAYDDTRVILQKIPGDPYSDYINANYIRGVGKERAYIATQGPMSNTIKDFWRMVWQEDVRVICMLTNVIEGTENKCEQYWPDVGNRVRYGEFLISNVEHQVFADFTFRTFKLNFESKTRKVSHLHYTGWPSFGIPTYLQSLALYLKKMMETPAGEGPVVVHCHTGDDRTGTVILCDICLRRVVKDRVIDVPAVITRLRDSRANMVGTLQQFLLAHIMITESLTALPTQVPCDNMLPNRIRQLRAQSPYDMQRLKDAMWQQQTLKSLAEPKPLGTVEGADDGLPEAGISGVVYANLHPTFESQISLIDGVSVDGVKMKRQHLASHLPPPFKLSNFWEFVTKMNVKLIIILQCSDPANPSCCDIMPDASMVPLLPHIELTEETNPGEGGDDEYFKFEKLVLAKASEENAEPQSVAVLTCGGWGRGTNGKPPEPVALVSLWIASEKVPRKEGQTLVLCHDGITACGLYLALSFTLERMAVERECDVISAVRAVRRSRPEFVQSVEQCEYLYDAVEKYAEYFQLYANFT